MLFHGVLLLLLQKLNPLQLSRWEVRFSTGRSNSSQVGWEAFTWYICSQEILISLLPMESLARVNSCCFGVCVDILPKKDGNPWFRERGQLVAQTEHPGMHTLMMCPQGQVLDFPWSRVSDGWWEHYLSPPALMARRQNADILKTISMQPTPSAFWQHHPGSAIINKTCLFEFSGWE